MKFNDYVYDSEIENYKKEIADLNSQIKKLADFIMQEISGEPSQSEGAVDCAIRIMREQKKKNKTAREAAKDLGIEVSKEEGQDRIDMLTGKRMSNE